MASLSYAQMKSRLNVGLRDSDNFSFTDAEKDEALTVAYNDPWAFIYQTDSSLTSVTNTFVYAYTALDRVVELGYDYYANGSSIPFPRSWWDHYNGQLRFTYDALNLLNQGKVLIAEGVHHLTTADLVPTTHQEYILNTARAAGIDMLIADKTQRFLRNDVTMPELQAAKGQAMQTAERLRKMLPNRHSVRV